MNRTLLILSIFLIYITLSIVLYISWLEPSEVIYSSPQFLNQENNSDSFESLLNESSSQSSLKIEPYNLESYYHSQTCPTPKNIYTDKEILEIFKYKNYGNCPKDLNENVVFINNSLKINCAGVSPLFATDKYTEEIYAGGTKDIPQWTKDLAPIGKKQFLFVKCSARSVFAFVFLWFDELKSKNKLKLAQSLGSNNRTMSVLLLVLDSVSRFSGQRNLPKTIEFLNSFKSGNKFSEYYEVFDFEKVAIPHARTVINMAQLFYGKTHLELYSILGTKLPSLKTPTTKYLNYQKNALWAHYSSLGYMTLFNHETSWDHLSPITGRSIAADHVLGNFWRSVYGLFQLHANTENERCLGGRDLHEYMLDYTLQFYQKYPKNHKFGYTHTNAAHETTGNVRKLDKDLIKFINDFLDVAMERNEDVALFFMSDHGYKDIKYGQWDFRSFYEYYTPMTHLVLSKNVVEKLEARGLLGFNSKELVSRYDMHLSLKDLAYFPYQQKDQVWYAEEKKKYKSDRVFSLFRERVDVGRSCFDFGIAKEFCLCSGFEKVEENELNAVVKSYIFKLANEYLQNDNKTKDCQIQDLISSKEFTSFRMKTFEYGLDTLYNLQITTPKGNKITIKSNFCTEVRIQKSQSILKDKPYTYFNFNTNSSQTKYFIQLSEIEIPKSCESFVCSC